MVLEIYGDVEFAENSHLVNGLHIHCVNVLQTLLFLSLFGLLRESSLNVNSSQPYLSFYSLSADF